MFTLDFRSITSKINLSINVMHLESLELDFPFDFLIVSTICKGYSPFIVIIKYWLHSLCCTIYSYSLFILPHLEIFLNF